MCKSINIAVLHISNTKSYGVMMLGTNFIYWMNKVSKRKFRYFVDTADFYNFKRLKLSLNENIKLETLVNKNSELYPKLPKTKNKIVKFIYLLKYINNYYKNFNKRKIKHVIVLGGDDFSEYYSIKGLFIEILKLINLSRHGIFVYLVGQTVGPFSSWRIILVKLFLKSKNVFISARDTGTYKYVKYKLNCRKVYKSSDLAILDLPKQNNKYIIGKYNLLEKKYITIIPSGLWMKYASSCDRYLDCWVSIIEKIINTYKYHVVLLPHVFAKDSNDIDIIEYINLNLSYEYRNNITFINDIMMPYEARNIIGNSLFTISGRMHGCISSLQMKTPSIALSYSIKYLNLIGEDLGMINTIIDAESRMDDCEYITNAIINKIEYILDNYILLVKTLNKKINMKKSCALNQLIEINNNIK